MLQTRTGKRTGLAAVRIAVDMVEEGLISREEAILARRPRPARPAPARRSSTDAKREAVEAGRVIANGLTAGPGAASGKVVFNAPDAEEWAGRGEAGHPRPRSRPRPEDIRGMNAAEGILTARGGMTSHAALVARQMGKVCVVGCEALHDRLPGRAR